MARIDWDIEVKVNSFALSAGAATLKHEHEEDIIYIFREDGEGMEISESELERILLDYMKANF